MWARLQPPQRWMRRLRRETKREASRAGQKSCGRAKFGARRLAAARRLAQASSKLHLAEYRKSAEPQGYVNIDIYNKSTNTYFEYLDLG